MKDLEGKRRNFLVGAEVLLSPSVVSLSCAFCNSIQHRCSHLERTEEYNCYKINFTIMSEEQRKTQSFLLSKGNYNKELLPVILNLFQDLTLFP